MTRRQSYLPELRLKAWTGFGQEREREPTVHGGCAALGRHHQQGQSRTRLDEQGRDGIGSGRTPLKERQPPTTQTPSSVAGATFVSGADVSSEEYERLALEMLSVEAGDVVDVKDAMRKIIASAPEGADIAFLLSRALAHAGDRARTSEPPLPLSREPGSAQSDHGSLPAIPNEGTGPSRWWAAAAAPLLGAAVLFGWLANQDLHAPDGGAHAAGTAATSMILLSVAFLGAGLIGVETLLLARWPRHGTVAPALGPACPPGWYIDPWGQGTSRWWNGSHWTGSLKGN